ncbi:MAG: hypothetical protein UZ08_BCD001002507 [Candidatus Parvibacillus calidus]|nr:MAG: hypothetical protein UZ08_BCD001002507 [Candidatus Parvibacillus calidus]
MVYNLCFATSYAYCKIKILLYALLLVCIWYYFV